MNLLLSRPISRSKLGFSTMADAAKAEALESLRDTYRTHFAYFESDQSVEVRGQEVQGLGLPADVLERFYWKNADEWYGLG